MPSISSTYQNSSSLIHRKPYDDDIKDTSTKNTNDEIKEHSPILVLNLRRIYGQLKNFFSFDSMFIYSSLQDNPSSLSPPPPSYGFSVETEAPGPLSLPSLSQPRKSKSCPDLNSSTTPLDRRSRSINPVSNNEWILFFSEELRTKDYIGGVSMVKN